MELRSDDLWVVASDGLCCGCACRLGPACMMLVGGHCPPYRVRNPDFGMRSQFEFGLRNWEFGVNLSSELGVRNAEFGCGRHASRLDLAISRNEPNWSEACIWQWFMKKV